MGLPWKIIDRFTTAGNNTLELRQRGRRDFILFLDGQILMNSSARRSEVALGQIGCRTWQNHPAPRVLVGGLGMGFTLKAALDTLPATAQVVVVELNQVIVDWCRGPLAGLTDNVLSDLRVTVKIGDVAHLIGCPTRIKEKDGFNAIILDLYKGPQAHNDRSEDPLYGSRAIACMRASLRSGGTLAVWGETYDEGYFKRLNKGGFRATWVRPGKGGYRHAVFLATKKAENLMRRTKNR